MQRGGRNNAESQSVVTRELCMYMSNERRFCHYKSGTSHRKYYPPPPPKHATRRPIYSGEPAELFCLNNFRMTCSSAGAKKDCIERQNDDIAYIEGREINETTVVYNNKISILLSMSTLFGCTIIPFSAHIILPSSYVLYNTGIFM